MPYLNHVVLLRLQLFYIFQVPFGRTPRRMFLQCLQMCSSPVSSMTFRIEDIDSVCSRLNKWSSRENPLQAAMGENRTDKRVLNWFFLGSLSYMIPFCYFNLYALLSQVFSDLFDIIGLLNRIPL